MQDSDPNFPGRTPDATGSWRAGPPAPIMGGDDPPTIRTGGSDPGSSHPRRTVLPPPQPGERLESFELVRPIGVGGMGAVYLATDSRLQREVALKILPPEQSLDSEVVQRFYQEGRAAAQLDHENIARVYTIGTDRGYHFIAFEYIEGITLRQEVTEKGPLSVAEAMDYTLQIAGALVHASGRGVVHRDVKPSNIVITRGGRAKLVDMGLARRFERGSSDEGLTQSGMTLGTFDYISPEQARDPRDVDVRGDLYSLGCTLFYMLTGRPPFPDGTVLQKLIQHQEEPPPDVRAINGQVPESLAAILVKLMAKDRDRRYQTPEALVRDLIALAGSLGLRSLGPEGLTWVTKTAPAWEKHLVWGIPTIALGVILLVLTKWGNPVDAPPPGAGFGEGTTPLAVPSVPENPEKNRTQGAIAPAPTTADGVEPPARPQPRTVTLKAGDDLGKAIATEVSGSTIVLGDEGPYLLAGNPPAPTGRRDLTIKAGPNARPVVRYSPLTTSGRSGRDSAMIRLGLGQVAIEGVEFRVDSTAAKSQTAMIVVEGTDLSLKRCLFRSSGRFDVGESATALEVRSPPNEGFRPAPVVGESCHFGSGLVAVVSRSDAELRFRDCSFGAGEPNFLFDSGGGAPISVHLTLLQTSFRPGIGPVIRAAGTAVKVRADRSIFASDGERDAILVAIDEAERLDWRGADNLYGGIATYLRAILDLSGTRTIRDFAAWADDAREYREAGSRTTTDPIWKNPRAGTPATASDPTAAFVLNEYRGGLGVRRGPFGAIASPVGALVASGSQGAARTKPPSLIDLLPKRGEPAKKGVTTAPEPKATAEVVMPMPKPPPEFEDPERVEPVRPKPTEVAVAPTDKTGEKPRDQDPVARMPPAEGEMPEPMPMPVAEAPPGEEVKPPAVAAVAPDRPKIDAPAVISTASGLREALAATKGGTIRIAADADLLVGSIDLKGPVRRVLQAEDGAKRPRIRFTLGRGDAARGDDRPALFNLQGGSLELQGIDVILEASEAPADGEWSAFSVRTGTELSLVRSTVTAAGRGKPAAIVEVTQSEENLGEGPGAADWSAAVVRASNSLLRSSGDVVDVAAGRRLDLDFTNVVVGCGASFVHGHGLARNRTVEPLKIVLRQTTTRLGGGLVFLESRPDEPELPTAEILVRDSVLANLRKETPLIRIDCQEGLDAVRNLIRWEGHRVFYHDIETYQRNQTVQTGTLPTLFDKGSWMVAVGTQDHAPDHGDAGFVNAWSPGRSPLSIDRDDSRLDPDGPASTTVGSDWRTIPVAPVLSTRP